MLFQYLNLVCVLICEDLQLLLFLDDQVFDLDSVRILLVLEVLPQLLV